MSLVWRVIILNTEMKRLQNDGVIQLSIPHLISKGLRVGEGEGEEEEWEWRLK